MTTVILFTIICIILLICASIPPRPVKRHRNPTFGMPDSYQRRDDR